ncbi:MAG: hypothetical protein BIFFINMI_02704 [Phycisphaerae bacterium]|nr:hypothetical protein [Phycisphaerae bacterium]
MRTAAAMSLIIGVLGMAHAAAAESTPATQPEEAVLDQRFPGLTAGCLAFARLEQLPSGVLLRSGELTVTDKELACEIARAPEAFQDDLRQNALLVLQQMVHERLLLAAARRDLGPGTPATTQPDDRAMLTAWIKPVVEKVKVDSAEVDRFYSDNEAMFGGAQLKEVREEIERYLLDRKQGRTVREHVRTLGRRMPIALSAEWVVAQQKLSAGNPIDRLRANGRPTLVDFGAPGCCGPDKMEPVLGAVGEQFGDKLNVLFVNVREHPFLAERFGIEDIPAQVLLDKAGRELFRNEGFMGEEELARRIRAAGIK